MVAGRCEFAGLVNLDLDGIANAQLAFLYIGYMIDRAIRQFLGIADLYMAKLADEQTFVTDLSATFCIERSLVENNADFFAVMDLIDQFAVFPDGNDFCFFGFRIYSQFADIDARKVRNGNTSVFCTGIAGAGALFFHGLIEAVFIQIQTILMQDLFRQFPWETECIIETETNLAVEAVFAGSLDGLDLFVQQVHSLIQGSSKAIFLNADDFLDIVRLVDEFLEVLGSAIDLYDCIHSTFQEFPFDAKHAAMTDRTAQDTAQDIAAAFIRRQDAIHDHNSHGTGMVSDYFQGDIFGLILAVLNICHFGCIFDDRIQEVGLKVRALVLHDRGQTLEAAAGIDILMSKVLIGTIFLAIILREYQIPDLKETVAITAYSAGRLAAAAVFTEIDVDLRVRAAWARSDFPEVVFQLDDMILREARLGFPDLNGFFIVRIYRDPKLVLRQFNDFRQEFPSPGDSLTLEVIAKGEVAQHLKERLMTCRAAYILDIARADTALAGRDTRARRFHLAREERLQRSHTGTNHQQCRIVFRNQRKARHTQMPFFLGEELQISFAQFITTHVLQKNLPPYRYFCNGNKTPL